MIYTVRLLRTGFFMLLLYTSVYGQNPYSNNIVAGYEERKKQMIAELSEKTRPDTIRANALIKVINTALINKQKKELMPYWEEALTLCRKLSYPKGLSRCYIWKGYFHKGASERSTANIYFDSAIVISDANPGEQHQKNKADAYRGKGFNYYEQENYYKALNYFFEALKGYETLDKTNSILMHEMITNIYLRVNNMEQATVYAAKNVALAEKNTNKALLVQAYTQLVDIYLIRNELLLATVYLDKIKPYMPLPVEVMVNFSYYQGRGTVHYRKKEFDSAFYYYKFANTIAENNGHLLNKAAGLNQLSKTALQMGNLALAKKYADENTLASENSKSKISKINALLNLSDYYHTTGNFRKAYDLMDQSLRLKDSLIKESNINQINTLAAAYESDKKEKEISGLQNERERQSAAVKQKSLLNKVFIISIITLLLIGYLGYLNFNKGTQLSKNQNELQRQKIKQLEKDKQLLSVEAMLKGQEEERSRIAKDLHDGLGGLLSGTKLSFINIKENLVLSSENSKLFDKSLSMLDNTIGDLRKVAQNLMPEALVKFGLSEALRDFCDSIQSASGIKVVYQQFGEIRKQDNTTEVFIYRIIQELVNNAVKHAEPGEIIVQLAMSPVKTCITVEDNGKGFDQNILSTTKGAGMTNITYRVQYLGGTTDIVSDPDNGTSVNIELKA